MQAYPFRCHSKIAARFIALHGMSFRRRQDQIIQMPNRANLGDIKSFDCEETAYDEDDERMEVVRQKPGSMSVGLEIGYFITYVALIPPTKVYNTTPTGSRNVAAMMWMPVLDCQ